MLGAPPGVGTSLTTPSGNCLAMTSSIHVQASRVPIFQLVGQGERISTSEKPRAVELPLEGFGDGLLGLDAPPAGLLTATRSR